ncbi:MAG: phosphopentomutase [Verrucomicrobiales bacterium]|nr:phosphopentomutase [bacterium]MDF2376002.1 phosphopentomutase [Verrucomicrobiales bacterium]
MKRALLIILDSVGIGNAPDAAAFGDEGANTVGHIREAVPEFCVPALDAAGLRAAEAIAAGKPVQGEPTLSYGCLTEVSAGKDTTTGHWELAGAPVTKAFSVFEKFPKSLVQEMEAATGVSFIGNYAQSGTVILGELGERHLESGHPILYTSADSVIQVAAHEESFGLERLYEVCRKLRLIADRERIGRVIARPFIGSPGNFTRTSNRHDFSLQPPETILNHLQDANIHTIGVGKISDIFAGSGITESHPTKSNAEACEVIDKRLGAPLERPHLIFANLVDFDMLYGHRRDPAGYGRALMDFDQWLSTLLPRLDDETLLLITADHGNDPTWTGTDHTRERVPLLARFPGSPRNLGIRDSYADVAATLADWFTVKSTGSGQSFHPVESDSLT